MKYEIRTQNGIYLGDLCYALSDRVYGQEWGDKHNFKDGAYKDSETSLEFAMVGTAYGDGCYPGSDGNNYPVDAGIIGICDLNLVEKEGAKDLGTFLPNWKGLVSIEYDDGNIIVENGGRQIVIKTDE